MSRIERKYCLHSTSFEIWVIWNLKFSYYFIFDRIVCLLVTFYQRGHFVMLIMRNLNLISVQSWTYLIKPPYQTKKQIWLSTLIILDITKTSSNNCLIFQDFAPVSLLKLVSCHIVWTAFVTKKLQMPKILMTILDWHLQFQMTSNSWCEVR